MLEGDPMTKLLAGVLYLSLAALVGVVKGEDSAVQLKRGTLVVLGEEAQQGGKQFVAYTWDGTAKRPTLLFRKRSKLCGDLHAIAVDRNGRQYYLNANRNLIVQADRAGKNEKVFFQHKGLYVRDLALDNDGNVYFSEATGGGGDRHIYRVRPARGQPAATSRANPASGTPNSQVRPSRGQTAATAELFCTVPLRDMISVLDRPDTGFWAGNFAFARDARGVLDTNTLYLSTGNRIPAAIFRMTRKDGKWSKPERLFWTNSPIMGLVFANPREAYCVRTQGRDGIKQVFRLTDLKKPEAVLTLDVTRVWHLSVVPRPGGEKSDLRKSSEQKKWVTVHPVEHVPLDCTAFLRQLLVTATERKGANYEGDHRGGPSSRRAWPDRAEGRGRRTATRSQA
jgi:hypothetical protein